MRIYRYTSVYLYTSTVVKITSICLNMDKHCGFLKSLSNYVIMCYKYSHTVICIPFYHRVVRKNDNPFGGIQLIICGDFLQLPPVTKGTDKKTFCFQVWFIISISHYQTVPRHTISMVIN